VNEDPYGTQRDPTAPLVPEPFDMSEVGIAASVEFP
jgi:hypothetical protein